MDEFRGVAAAPGIAVGPVFQYRAAVVVPAETPTEDTQAEWRRLEEARSRARDQLAVVRELALQSSGASAAEIFDAQAAMLDDPELLDLCRKELASRGVNVEVVWMDAVQHFALSLESLEDEYLRARAADVRDVGARVLRLLAGEHGQLPALQRSSIILAEDLSPSDTIMLDRRYVLGFCIAAGGVTSHTAILARSLGLPAVVGAGSRLLAIADETQAILDGDAGSLLVDPPLDILQRGEARKRAQTESLTAARARAADPVLTRDRIRVEVVANIGNVADARRALENGAEGVGLLRTEFLYLERQTLPDEEQQFRAYRDILDVFGGRPVVLRTLDIGGDKAIPYLKLPAESNPFLGVRGLRLCLRRPDLFEPQLRAALRASAGHNLKIMFPMVTALHEVQAARHIVDRLRQDLSARAIPVSQELEIGIMVEVPSAAVMAERLAPHVDFFSIGTNDLAQYALAADRSNAALAELASAFSPAVLRLIEMVINAAHAHGKWVGVCGELAGEQLALPILLGLGLDEFSMNPPAIPLSKQTLRRLNAAACRDVASRALLLESANSVRDLVLKEFPWLQAGAGESGMPAPPPSG